METPHLFQLGRRPPSLTSSTSFVISMATPWDVAMRKSVRLPGRRPENVQSRLIPMVARDTECVPACIYFMIFNYNPELSLEERKERGRENGRDGDGERIENEKGREGERENEREG